MATLNSCCRCCYFFVKAGALAVAILFLGFSLFQIGTTANSLLNHKYVERDLQNIQNVVDDFNKSIVSDLTTQLEETVHNNDTSFEIHRNDSVSETVDEKVQEIQVSKSQLITALGVSITQAISGGLMLFGAIKYLSSTSWW